MITSAVFREEFTVQSLYNAVFGFQRNGLCYSESCFRGTILEVLVCDV